MATTKCASRHRWESKRLSLRDTRSSFYKWDRRRINKKSWCQMQQEFISSPEWRSCNRYKFKNVFQTVWNNEKNIVYCRKYIVLFSNWLICQFVTHRLLYYSESTPDTRRNQTIDRMRLHQDRNMMRGSQSWWSTSNWKCRRTDVVQIYYPGPGLGPRLLWLIKVWELCRWHSERVHHLPESELRN